MLQANPSCRASVSDVSATAVANLRAQAESLEILKDRLQAFVADATDPGQYDHACSREHGPADIVMMVFTLSAVPPEAMGSALQTAWAQLQSGGVLLIRDYGRYDMTALRFPPEQRIADGLYFRCAAITLPASLSTLIRPFRYSQSMHSASMLHCTLHDVPFPCSLMMNLE